MKNKDKMPSRRFSNLKKSAVRRNIEVDINLSDYIKLLKDNDYLCYYCGDEVKDSTGGNLDRVDNKIGYNLQNVRVCCKVCNTMKSVMDEVDFYNHINKIIKKKLP